MKLQWLISKLGQPKFLKNKSDFQFTKLILALQKKNHLFIRKEDLSQSFWEALWLNTKNWNKQTTKTLHLMINQFSLRFQMSKKRRLDKGKDL